MTVFFVDWDLWQEMTFVLACCIVSVFLIGIVRLWLTTQAIRRLEVIDEEKRTRTVDMRQCDIDIWRSDDIPFGVRALQAGVEVDGIWVSRPYHRESSNVASSDTLMGEHLDEPKQERHCSDRGKDTEAKAEHISGALTLDQVLHMKSTSHKSSGSAPDLSMLHKITRGTNEAPRNQAEQVNEKVWSYVPTGSQSAASPNASSTPLPHIWEPSTSMSYPPVGTTSSLSASIPISKVTVVPGSVAVHANKATRRPNKNFEVLPAGTFGPGTETARLVMPSHLESRLPRFQPGPAKLRKKTPPKPENVM